MPTDSGGENHKAADARMFRQGADGMLPWWAFLIIKENAMPATKKSVASISDDHDEIGRAIGAVATALGVIANEFPDSYKIGEIGDNLGNIANQLSTLEWLARSIDMATIARYGEDDDRAKVVAYLKRQHHDQFD